MNNQNVREITISVDSTFAAYLPNASARFAYLRPEVKLEVQDHRVIIRVAASDEEVATVTQDFRFCLYREKIYRETLPLRQRLIQGVMGR